MRYFLIQCSGTISDTQRMDTSMTVSNNQMPSFTEIKDYFEKSNNVKAKEFRVTGIFEFSSKEDFDNFKKYNKGTVFQMVR